MIYGIGTIMYPNVITMIQITVKNRKSLLDKKVQGTMLESMKGFKERYAIEIQQVGFDRNHVQILCRFLPKYSGGQVI